MLLGDVERGKKVRKVKKKKVIFGRVIMLERRKRMTMRDGFVMVRCFTVR